LTEIKYKSITKGSKKARIVAARLAAVQIVYQLHMNGNTAQEALDEYIAHHSGEDVDGEKMVTPDVQILTNIVKNVEKRKDTIGAMITQALSLRGADKQIEPLLMSIILCGVCELITNNNTDPPIIISDYLEVTHAFYEHGEHGLVNAVLDAVKETLSTQV